MELAHPLLSLRSHRIRQPQGVAELEVLQRMKTLTTRRRLIQFLAIFFTAFSPISFGQGPTTKEPEKVTVHLIGNVKQPGPHMIPARAQIADIIAACGGEDEFSAFKRMILIRFPRQEGVTEGAIDQRKDEILRGAQIPRDGEFYLLQQGDVIYIPVKEIIGR